MLTLLRLYSKTNQMHNISNLFHFGTTLYRFRTVSPSIIRILRLYIQLYHDNVRAHSTALVQIFLWQSVTSVQVCQTPIPQIWLPATLVFPRAKIAVENEEICEWDGHTVHKPN